MSKNLRIDRVYGQPMTLPLARPLMTSRGRVEEREILVLICELECPETGKRVTGYGEAAPLPGWSSETVAQCMSAIDGVEELDANLDGFPDMPTLRFGLELAILDGMARFEEVTLRDLMARRFGVDAADDEVAVQATLGVADIQSTCVQAEEAVNKGAKAIKFKVGKALIGDDLKRIRTVRERCPNVAIRLDVNGAWSREQAYDFLDEARELSLDLIEQPVTASDVDGLLELAKNSEVTIAVDEGLFARRTDGTSGILAAREMVDRGIDGLVLKPMALGGLRTSWELADYATSRGVRVIWSTLIESAIGRRAVAQLAAILTEVKGPHGLATGAWFESDLAPTDDVIESGILKLDEEPGIGFVPHLQQVGQA
jgi:L-Ala-D/L-Glu epimerase